MRYLMHFAIGPLFALALMGSASASAADEVAVVDGVELPGVSMPVASAIPNARPAPADKVGPSSSGAVTMRFGETNVITIARDRLNRIVTPFPQLRVKRPADDSVTVETEGSVFYLNTTSDEPVSLYLLDASDPVKALSVVLMPKQVMPADLTIRIPNYAVAEALVAKRDASSAASWEREQPYVTTIMRVFKELASGKTPPGYGLREVPVGSFMPPCSMPGLQVEAAQVVDGHDVTTYIGRVTNVTFAPVEVHEVGCVTPGVLAVAVWPNTVLRPRQSSEIYIAVRRDNADGYDARPRVGGVYGQE